MYARAEEQCFIELARLVPFAHFEGTTARSPVISPTLCGASPRGDIEADLQVRRGAQSTHSKDPEILRAELEVVEYRLDVDDLLELAGLLPLVVNILSRFELRDERDIPTSVVLMGDCHATEERSAWDRPLRQKAKPPSFEGGFSVGWVWWTGLELLLDPFSRHMLDLEPPQSAGCVFRERSW